MNSIPYELVNHILTFLPDTPLHLYATISREWQPVIEHHTFSAIKLHSLDLPHFTRIFNHPHRRKALASLEYHIDLPAHSDTSEDSAVFEDNATFTTALTDLLAHLASWGLPGRDIKIELKACPLSGTIQHPHISLSLLPPLSIPLVPRIVRLDIISPRRISGAVVSTLAVRLPNLYEAQWFLYDELPCQKYHRDGSLSHTSPVLRAC
jgi:hypothetical protein